MIRALRKRFGAHLEDEDGAVSIEFFLVVGVVVSVMVIGLELGFINLRQALLERGLDMAVREVRLGTGTDPQHDDIKELVCQNSIFIKFCEDNLFLEMVPDDIRSYAGLNELPHCTDVPAPSRPVREFTPGQPNELMLMRACLKFEPIFPEAFLAQRLTTDGEGNAVIVAVTSFVQEPS